MSIKKKRKKENQNVISQKYFSSTKAVWDLHVKDNGNCYLFYSKHFFPVENSQLTKKSPSGVADHAIPRMKQVLTGDRFWPHRPAAELQAAWRHSGWPQTQEFSGPKAELASVTQLPGPQPHNRFFQMIIICTHSYSHRIGMDRKCWLAGISHLIC